MVRKSEELCVGVASDGCLGDGLACDKRKSHRAGQRQKEAVMMQCNEVLGAGIDSAWNHDNELDRHRLTLHSKIWEERKSSKNGGQSISCFLFVLILILSLTTRFRRARHEEEEEGKGDRGQGQADSVRDRGEECTR